MNPKLRQFIIFLIGWPLSLAAIYFITKTFLPKITEIRHLLNSVNILLLITGIICFLVYYLFRSIVWHKILSIMGYKFPYAQSTYFWATSEFKRYIPGNIWSFLSRSVLFTAKGMTKSHIAKALLTEVQLIFLACIIISLLSLPYFSQYVFPDITLFPIIRLFLPFIILIGMLIYIYQTYLLTPFNTKVKRFLLHILPDFTPEQTFWLLFISCIALLFFGLGYYFSISSIKILFPRMVLSLTGFFVFSLLVGLLSFITPTGLGIREGSITIGLSKILPLGIAGFMSVFGRIILVFSEILFLSIAYILSRISNQLMQPVYRFISQHKYEIVLGVLIFIFSFYFITVSFLRHDNFYTGRFDLGNMDQTVWNTKNGRIFEFTNPDGTNIVSRLAFHADFILILLAPLYFIWDDPKTLLALQTVVVGLGAVFLYLLANKVFSNQTSVGGFQKTVHRSSVIQSDNLKTPIKSGKTDNQIKLLALAFSFSYLMNPSIHWGMLYDFHAVTLATTFLLASFYFIYTKQYLWFAIFALLSGFTKEQVWIPVGLMGLYITLKAIFANKVFSNQTSVGGFQKTVHRSSVIQSDNLKTPIKSGKTDKSTADPDLIGADNRKNLLFGLAIFIASITVFYYLVWYAIPQAASNNQHFALSYFNESAQNPSDLLKNIFLSPAESVNKLLAEDRIAYIKGLFDPLGYLPLLAPWYLLFPLADIFLNLLSDKPELHQIYYQYSAVITPFIYIAAIFGIFKLKSLVKGLPYSILTIFIIQSVIFGGYINGPLPWTTKPNIAMFTIPQPNKEYIHESLHEIPAYYKVTATNNLGAHLTRRQYLYTIPLGVDSADIVAFLIRPNSPEEETELITALRIDPKYTILQEKGGFIVFKNIKY